MTTSARRPVVVIDAFPESVARYQADHAIVAVDVIRATTMAVTAVALGRRCLIADSLEDAFALRSRWPDALLAGELAGRQPDGFDLNNSPADLAARSDIERPIVMLSSSGTRLMSAAARAEHGAYVACFRNAAAVADHLSGRHARVAVIGAGSRGVFREEDEMACAWIAGRLVADGYAATPATLEAIERWAERPATACETGDSVAYLRRSGQMRDYAFIVDHVDDLDLVVQLADREAISAGSSRLVA